MNLHDVFLFLLHFDDKLPHTFLMWLDKYPKLEQDSFVCLIINSKTYKLKPKLRNKNFDHKTVHKPGCMCDHYYNILINMISFPCSIVGKCLGNRTYRTSPATEEFSTYSEVVGAALSFHDIPIIKTQKLKTNRFKEFPRYKARPGKLTVYSLLTLLKKEDFNLFTLTRHLDVIEIALIYVLVNGAFSTRFVDNFLPNYCRTLRFIDNTIAKDNHRDILVEIYNKFFNIDLRTQFPTVNYVSMALRPIRVCSRVPSQSETIQLGYVGERFVMHVTTRKMHVMNDFGEYLGVYSQYTEHPFDDDAEFIIECVKTKTRCFVVDIYMYNKVLVYHESPRTRANILMGLAINKTSEIELAPLISMSDIGKHQDVSQDILKYGYRDLPYDSLVFRCNNSKVILKYYIKKPHIVFEKCGAVRTKYTPGVDCSYGSKFCGYFLLKAEDNSWLIHVWSVNLFVSVGRLSLPVSFFGNKKNNFIVKVYFNLIVDNKLQDIVAVVPKKFKSIYNCLSMEDLVKIK